RPVSRVIHELARGAGGDGIRAATIGTRVCAMMSEASIATTMLTATCVRNTVMLVLMPNRIGTSTVFFSSLTMKNIDKLKDLIWRVLQSD
ncbi:MAG: hypothetical protein R6V75_00380, partial [Bacteroidales bacterium]